MKTETRNIHRCEYCNKIYLSSYWCKRHETRCSNNPENDRACFSCSHLGKKEAVISGDHFDGSEYFGVVSGYFCNKLGKFLIPPNAQHKGNAYEFSDYINENMPKKCEFKETIGGSELIEILNIKV